MEVPAVGDRFEYEGIEFIVVERIEEDGWVTLKYEHPWTFQPYEVVE